MGRNGLRILQSAERMAEGLQADALGATEVTDHAGRAGGVMARTKREILQKCKWAEDEDGLWQTDCGQEFSFIDAGPNENHMCCNGRSFTSMSIRP